MQNLRNEFRAFLLRVADNNLRDDDWITFVTQHFFDEEIEQLRQSLVRRSLDFPDWQIGWIPRALQEAARGLAECLFDIDENSVRYCPEWSEILDDGTIRIKVTWSDDHTLSTGISDFRPENPEYSFWKWLVLHPKLRRGRKSKAEILSLQAQYHNQG